MKFQGQYTQLKYLAHNTELPGIKHCVRRRYPRLCTRAAESELSILS